MHTRTLRRPILPDADTVVALRLRIGRRRGLIREQKRRLRLLGLLCGIHSRLERILDVASRGPLVLLARYVTPAGIRRAGKRRLMAYLARSPHPRGIEGLAGCAVDAARARRITVPGGMATAGLVRKPAAEALEARYKLARLDSDLEALLASHPHGALTRPLPGMVTVLAAELIACIGDKALKRVFYQGAFCAVSIGDPISKAFHDRKRREQKHHTQALIALARRRLTVLCTMLSRHEAFGAIRKAA